MYFEWEEDKRRSNIDKHGVDFVLAAKIFANPILEAADDRDDYGEDRRMAIGHWEDHCLVMVYV